MGARITLGIVKPLGGVALIVVAVAVLVQEPPQSVSVWFATLSALTAAGFIIWRLNVPESYSSMNRTRLKVHVAGNAVMLVTCVVAAYVCATLLPPAPTLVVVVGFAYAAVIVAVRLWLVVAARHRFAVWR